MRAFALVAFALVAGCAGGGGSAPPISAGPAAGSAPASTVRRSDAAAPLSHYKTLYRFRGGMDGANPYEPMLIAVNGILFGTTSAGGSANKGTVFKITTAGSEAVVHSFGESSDGSTPTMGLTNVKGMLLGTTELGGAHSKGVLFGITCPERRACCTISVKASTVRTRRAACCR